MDTVKIGTIFIFKFQKVLQYIFNVIYKPLTSVDTLEILQ